MKMKPRSMLVYRLFLLISLITLPLVACSSTEPPLAQFGLDQDAVATDQTIQFNDQSTGEVATWSWDFGDNTTSSEQSPSHSYSSPGSYTVILTVSNEAGSSSASSTIDVVEALVAEFSASATRVLVGDEIEFTYESTGDIDSLHWDFGDDTTSMQFSPEHSYDAPGVYTVSLTVSNDETSNTIVKEDYIQISSLSVESVFSSNVTETGEYTPAEGEIFQSGEEIWLVCTLTGFECRETEDGYEAWLRVQQINGVILDEENVIEAHDFLPVPPESVDIFVYLGSQDVDNEAGLSLFTIDVIIEDVIGGFTVTVGRVLLITE